MQIVISSCKLACTVQTNPLAQVILIIIWWSSSYHLHIMLSLSSCLHCSSKPTGSSNFCDNINDHHHCTFIFIIILSYHHANWLVLFKQTQWRRWWWYITYNYIIIISYRYTNICNFIFWNKIFSGDLAQGWYCSSEKR